MAESTIVQFPHAGQPLHENKAYRDAPEDIYLMCDRITAKHPELTLLAGKPKKILFQKKPSRDRVTQEVIRSKVKVFTAIQELVNPYQYMIILDEFTWLRNLDLHEAILAECLFKFEENATTGKLFIAKADAALHLNFIRIYGDKFGEAKPIKNLLQLDLFQEETA